MSPRSSSCCFCAQCVQCALILLSLSLSLTALLFLFHLPSALNFPRYKIIVQVFVGQQKQQGIRVASRCLWDTETDSVGSYTYNNDSLWATVMVFGLYVD